MPVVGVGFGIGARLWAKRILLIAITQGDTIPEGRAGQPAVDSAVLKVEKVEEGQSRKLVAEILPHPHLQNEPLRFGLKPIPAPLLVHAAPNPTQRDRASCVSTPLLGSGPPFAARTHHSRIS